MMIQIEHSDTLHSVFRKRVEASPDTVAYQQFDAAAGVWRLFLWRDVAARVERWRHSLVREGLAPGERVAVMLNNCIEWIVFDQAALSLGLVTVPLFNEDNVGNYTHILRDSGACLLLVGRRRQLDKLKTALKELPDLSRIICLEAIDNGSDERVIAASDWLSGGAAEPGPDRAEATDLATLIYTSGTTGRPKGVMLTHSNIVNSILFTSRVVEIGERDSLVSFLPLAHVFERVVGYYMTMMIGAQVAFARSIVSLMEDIQHHKPTVLLSVPRIYERVYNKLQSRFNTPLLRWFLRSAVTLGEIRNHAQSRGYRTVAAGLAWSLFDKLLAAKVRGIFGGRLKYAVSGGAPLSPEVARLFLAFGVPLYQGYGLTESAAAVSVNRPGSNRPESIGLPIAGIEVRIGEHDELLTRSPCVMRGYWGLDDETRRAVDGQQWLHTGDMAREDEHGHLFITGRIKELIVMSNGEKVPPADIEMALQNEPLISQVMVHGEGRPFLVALVVPEAEALKQPRQGSAPLTDVRLADEIRKRAVKRLTGFPAYARIRRVIVVTTAWGVDNGMLTPTMKMKRQRIAEAYADEIEACYRGFE